MHDSVVLDMCYEERGLLSQIQELFEDTALGTFKSRLSIGKDYGNMREI